MSACDRCGYSGGKHDSGCPEPMVGPTKALAMKDWQAGYRQGHSGYDKPVGANPSYSLGFAQGVVALEEGENGFDPNAGFEEYGEFEDVYLDD